jgi:signal transduction histidine kinase
MGRSIKGRLLITTLVSLTAAWTATLTAGYLMTEKTLNEQLDHQLKQMAQTLSQEAITTETTVKIHHSEKSSQSRDQANAPDSMTIEFQVWREDKMIRYSDQAPPKAFSDTEGYSQNEVGQKKWRVFSTTKDDSRILVGQDLDMRQSLIHGMILSSLWPMGVALPAIALILWISITLALAPLSSLASAIQERTPERLSKIPLGSIPDEVVPVVQSLNTLLTVVEQALESERQFADDAAHELRTPLTGIKVQAEAALRSTHEAERTKGLLSIIQGIDRATRIANQLLTLARIQPSYLQTSFSAVDLGALVTQVIEKFTPQALAKDIDLGWVERERTGHTLITGDFMSLEIMISNLIDNAIKYSLPGGKVDIYLQKQHSRIALNIEDQGPGIPTTEKERVFNRFVRLQGNKVEGSGIGLSVVKKIVELHHAEIELSTPRDHAGLKVTVVFPKTEFRSG